jgi:hypothetical protein
MSKLYCCSIFIINGEYFITTTVRNVVVLYMELYFWKIKILAKADCLSTFIPVSNLMFLQQNIIQHNI